MYRIWIQWFRIRIQHFRLNTDPDPAPGFWRPKTEKFNSGKKWYFLIKNCNLVLIPKDLQLLEKPSSTLKREHPAKNMKFLNFFLYLWVISALLRVHVLDWIQTPSGSGSETLLPSTGGYRNEGPNRQKKPVTRKKACHKRFHYQIMRLTEGNSTSQAAFAGESFQKWLEIHTKCHNEIQVKKYTRLQHTNGQLLNGFNGLYCGLHRKSHFSEKKLFFKSNFCSKLPRALNAKNMSKNAWKLSFIYRYPVLTKAYPKVSFPGNFNPARRSL